MLNETILRQKVYQALVVSKVPHKILEVGITNVIG